MKRVRLIHWNAEEAKQRAKILVSTGYQVDCKSLDPAGLKDLKTKPPAAIVIDLTRLPSNGREVGIYLRKQKATRHIPLIYVEGEPDKVERIKKLLPDANYTSWSRIKSALKKAVSKPPKEPVVPTSSFEAYKGTPLVKKLGIKPKSIITLVGAPKNFKSTLGRLPASVTFKTQLRGSCDLMIWFVKSAADLEKRIDIIKIKLGAGGLWIAWPKKTSDVPSDLTQPLVRKIGLAAGLVDYKVCRIDETFTALKFTSRKSR